jgi:hypothetical protein
MTIRDHLRRRGRIWWSAFLLSLLGLILFGPQSNIVAIVMFIVLFGCIVTQFWLFKCPKCSKHFNPSLNVSKHRVFEPINYCPYCGVSLDEPMSA